MTQPGHDPRRLTPEQRAVLLKLEEIIHQPGTLSDGERWCPVQKKLLLDSVALIQELRRVE